MVDMPVKEKRAISTPDGQTSLALARSEEGEDGQQRGRAQVNRRKRHDPVQNCHLVKITNRHGLRPFHAE